MEGDLGWCRGGSSSNNWDLHAVVRFACGGPSQVQGAGPSSPPPSDESFSWPLPMPQPQWHDDPAVDELFQALLAAPEPEVAPHPSSPRNEEPETQQPAPADEAPAKPRRGSGGPTRSKRKSKKNQVSKEVKRVPAGGPSADLWAWRKYGQKPIKGSPYPRGYYRCSTDKDCKARKQVERCRADPATLIVTYTGEHSHPVPLHRNSLAGTTRTKPSQQQQQQAQSPPPSDSATALSSAPSPGDDSANSNKQAQGSPASGLSPATTLRSPSVSVGVESYEDEEDDDTLDVRLLLEDTDMGHAEDHALLFLQPEELAPVLGSGDDVMPLPKPDEPVAGMGNDLMLVPNNKADGPGPCPVSCGRADGVMLFPNLGEPQPATTVNASIANGGTGIAPAMNFGEETKFSISALSAWEAVAASGWGL